MAVKSPEKSLYSQFCDYMERETRGVEVSIVVLYEKYLGKDFVYHFFLEFPQIGVYTISGILFAVACHRIRPVRHAQYPS